MRPTRRERERRRLQAEIDARARILPEPSTRTAKPPARMNSLGDVYLDAVNAANQTPESWARTWADASPHPTCNGPSGR